MTAAPRPATDGHLSAPMRRVVVALLLLGGAWFAYNAGAHADWRQTAIVTGTATVGAWASCRLRLSGPTIRLNRIGRLAVAVTLFLTSAVYLYTTARSQGRAFAPIIHDEHCYLIQSRMLAAGHLWMPRHELAEFFDSFHLLTDRVYASKYSPGTALFYAPALRAGLPHWLAPLLLSALAVALLYLLIADLVGDTAGLLGALMLLACTIFRRVSIEALAQPPMLCLTLLAWLAFARWWRTRSIGWALLLGVAIGWGAITRPADAVILALPLGVAILVRLRSTPARRATISLLTMLCASAPFLALQAIYNQGVTGHYTTLPWSHYARLYDPGDGLAATAHAPAPSAPLLPQKRVMTEQFTQAEVRTNQERGRLGTFAARVRTTLRRGLPSPWLAALVPLGLMRLTNSGRRVMVASLAAFLLLYTAYTFFIPIYALAGAPVLILCVLLAVEAAGPASARGALHAAILCVTVISLPHLSPSAARDEWDLPADTLRQVDHQLATLDHTPAVVLFHFDPARDNPHVEPVYNTDVAWPDDAPVIRAHDLDDPANRRIYAYYARQSPARAFYRYDRAAGGRLTYLGTARELADRSN